MTVKYNYKCSSCKVTYLEQRPTEQPQLVFDCQNCNAGTYEETSFEIISDTVEQTPAPKVIEVVEVIEEITEEATE